MYYKQGHQPFPVDANIERNQRRQRQNRSGIDRICVFHGMGMMREKYFLVYNPVAGKVKLPNFLDMVEKFFQEMGAQCDVYTTTGQEDIPKIVREKIQDGCTTIIAAGGDGTIFEVVKGMLGSQVVLCVIPLGTANGLAFALGIPRDPWAAISLLQTGGKTEEVYPIMVNETLPSLVHITVGVHALAIRTTKRRWKRIFGLVSYIVVAIKWVLTGRKHRWHFVVHTTRAAHSFRASTVAIGNRGRFNEFLKKYLTPLPNNPLSLLMVVVQAYSLRDYVRGTIALFFGRWQISSKIKTVSFDETVHISSNKPAPVQVDGEPVGTTPISVTRSHHPVLIIISQ